ncbi:MULTISPECIES: bifunctional diguanylate cyclase/phosphodiesterase [unclassified Clostridium]|uniref:putative bifunctional diguanylate cyclase/phosphodiesterase n=1 Tax=unclassified Clostridium TaxID=2614128 RepID=UPI0013F01752|nr:bifunctional diguanylate cyclase/phosphodiesterase [Clostridium botulinum]NFQ09649.1 bifunctional diguanylate cyclase/phosphodiesterase [Clostridium botulinum]
MKHKYNSKIINFEQASTIYKLIDNSTDDYVFIWDVNSNVFKISSSILCDFDLDGTTTSDIEEYWSKIIYNDDKDIFLHGINKIKSGLSNINIFQCRLVNKKGEVIWISFRGSLLKDENENAIIVFGHITDMNKDTKIDFITGVLNRSKFQEDMMNFLDNKSEIVSAVIVMGIDNFKNINEKHGYLFGDMVIRDVAQKITLMLPKNMNIYRIDGDKFAIFYKDANYKKVEVLFNNIKDYMNVQHEIDDKKYFCTLSCGVALYPNDALSCMELFQRANSAMEFAKISGKNRLEFFSEELYNKKIRFLTLQEQLRESIRNNFDGFELYYQPQVKASNHELKGAEALLRWNSPELGEISPLEFIPFLEESGLIVKVGKWVIREALKMCMNWQSIIEDFKMSINVSYIQLKEDNFNVYLDECIKEFGINKNSVILELTESCWAPDFKFLIKKFADFEEYGINMAIDDFGTGYSSLNYLRNLPVNIVKIDRSFVRHLTEKSYNFTFIEYVIKLMHSINIKVCIEGIETVEEFEIINKVNPDYIQGYLFGKPESTDMFYRKFIDAKEQLLV